MNKNMDEAVNILVLITLQIFNTEATGFNAIYH